MKIVIRITCLVTVIGSLFSIAGAQTTSVTSAESSLERSYTTVQEKRKRTPTATATPVIVQNDFIAPQIVTILHRLSGLKVMRLLGRSSEELAAIASLDEAFKIGKEVHTNVIAGLALDDGRTIAAWLPEAEAEMAPSAFHYAPHSQTPPTAPAAVNPPQPPSPTAPLSIPAMPGVPFPAGVFEPADLKIVTRDGKRLLGRYVGLDGLTGLSIISLTGANLPPIIESKEPVSLGQRLRLIGPQPAPRPEVSPRGSAMYVRIGQTDATISGISKSPTGSTTRIKIKANKLTAANIGSIAVSESGETLGILDAVNGNEATIVPVAAVRSAMKRVMTRQASVPRPWLGVRGEPIGGLTLDKIQGVGWQKERARELCENQNGILLTQVVPGSPAALNQLKPGDVILTVNKELIKNGEDFSWILQEAGPGSSVHFTVARPGKPATEDLQIQLSESPDPLFGRRVSLGHAPRLVEAGSLISQGVEAVALKPKAATRFGAAGGLLVVYVQPATPAFNAGLRPGDVIESIDGKDLTSGRYKKPLIKHPGTSSAFGIVRKKQRLVVSIPTVNTVSNK
jgi:S1-C subfamily serine protease